MESEKKITNNLVSGDKVIVNLNGIKTAEGVIVKPEEVNFSIREGNIAVQIIKTFHPIAKKGIWQFSKCDVERI